MCTGGVLSRGGGAAFWQALKKILVFLTPVAALGLGLIAIFMDWKDPRMYHFGFLLTAVMSAIVIADSVLMVSPALQKLLLMKWLVWTGSISYGLYLWHYPIYRMMRDLGANNDRTLLFGSMLTFIAAAASYRYLEQPILRRKKKFSYVKAEA